MSVTSQQKDDLAINDASSAERPKKRSSGRFVKPKFFVYGFLFGILTVIVAGAIVYFQGVFAPEPEPVIEPVSEPEPEIVDETYVRERLMPAAELTSAKYVFSGIMDYDNKKIPVVNRSKFSMFYSATVRIGIEDLSDSIIEVTDDTVTVILPASTITEVTIHPDTLRFFDQKDSLLSSHKRDQVKEVLVKVEEDARKADMTACLDVADENAEEVVRDFLTKTDSLGGRELVIKHMPRRSATAETAKINSEAY